MNKTQLRILVFVITVLLLFSPSRQVMGMLRDHFDETDFSGALYTYHGDQQVGQQLSESSCVYCHLNPQATSLASIMASFGITCTNCHGVMTQFNAPERITSSMLPSCNACHHQVIPASTWIETGEIKILPDCSSEIQNDALTDRQDNGWSMDGSNEFMDCSACHTINQAATIWHFGMEQ